MVSNIALTPGQQRIRTVFTQALPQYRTTDKNTKEQSLLFLHLRQELASDPIIHNDSITGHVLGYSRIADAYCRWIGMITSPNDIKILTSPNDAETCSVFRLDQFIYDYTIRTEKNPIHAYCGGVGSEAIWGVPYQNTRAIDEEIPWYLTKRSGTPPPVLLTNQPKWASTYWALFELARIGQTPRAGEALSLTYYEPYGILKVGTGGNHRTLAHVLWGHPQIVWDTLTLYSCREPFDHALNSALLVIEDVLCALWCNPDTSVVMSPPLIPDIEVTLGRIQDIIEFAQKTPREEMAILRDYIIHIRQNTLTIDWLYVQREELRQCLVPSSPGSWCERIRNKIQGYKPHISDFKRWYQGRVEVF